MKIERIEAKSIPDTRGRPTIEVTLFANGKSATASVPSGKSTGSHEAHELRDPDGGVEQALQNVRGEIAALLSTNELETPDALDELLIRLDGTPNKSRLGANAILAVSIAGQRLFAAEAGEELWRSIARRGGTKPMPPRLYVNAINGGVHAEFRLPFQEYILVCEGKTSEALAVARAGFEFLGEKLGNVPMGDEGGYSPTFSELEAPFDLLREVVEAHPGTSIAIDAAATELKDGDGYKLLGKHYSSQELGAVYRDLAAKYPMHSIEDPFSEDADADFIELTASLKKTLVVGDDFTVTNPARIEHTIREKSINAVLIKPNQIGTVKEAIEAVQKTHAAGWAAICSHRSGETDDTFIADFAYGVGAHGIKAGGLAQKERLEKYDRLLEIEKEAAA